MTILADTRVITLVLNIYGFVVVRDAGEVLLYVLLEVKGQGSEKLSTATQLANIVAYLTTNDVAQVLAALVEVRGEDSVDLL